MGVEQSAPVVLNRIVKMGLSCEKLVDEIQVEAGRKGDTKLIDDTWCTRRLNEAQVYIVDHCPQIRDFEFKNRSLTFATDCISYDIGDITAADTTDEGVAFIQNVWLIDGANSILLDFQPTDEFDAVLIDSTSSEHSGSKPTRWTRRANNIEVAPRPSSDYNGDYMRVDGVRYAAEFTTNDSSASEIPDADEGLEYYAVAKAFGAMGDENRRRIWWKKFTNPDPLPGEDYGWLQDFQDKHGRMEAWDGNILFDYPEGDTP